MLTIIPTIYAAAKLQATFISTAARSYKYLTKSQEEVVNLGICEATDNSEDAVRVSQVDFDPSVLGLNNARSTEPVPQRDKAAGEREITNQNNARIVLGRDRPASKASGYGGAGHSQASAIDLSVGMMNAVGPREEIHADPNFKADSARIYISQKADIDEYLDLCDGSVGKSTARSTIGLKADSIRLASRQGMKLVTGTDDTNSWGSLLMSTKGIDLIAGNNDESLQPIPLGGNLTEAIKELKDNLSDLNGTVITFMMNQMAFNAGVQAHTHAPSFGMGPSIDLLPVGIPVHTNLISKLPNLWLNKVNMLMFDFNYLFPFGPKYINGQNRTN
jgi:hypothetical protein